MKQIVCLLVSNLLQCVEDAAGARAELHPPSRGEYLNILQKKEEIMDQSTEAIFLPHVQLDVHPPPELCGGGGARGIRVGRRGDQPEHDST